MISTDWIKALSRPDATMSAVLNRRCCNCWISSTPSMPGISRSTISRSGGNTSMPSSSSASAPLAAS